MIHFAYPNAKQTSNRFIGCGRYIASEHNPGDEYDHPSKIMGQEKVEKAAQILAYESFQTKKNIWEKKDRPEFVYQGESKNLAYLLAMISRSRKVKLNIDNDIWCTGSIKVINNEPSLNAVINTGFDIKLRQGFLSDENQDKLFIVPEDNFPQSHHDLCKQLNINVFSIEQFREQADYAFETKTILKVRSDELYHLTSIVFEMGRNPYKGLEYFDKDDAELFFGREDLIQDILKNYQNICNSPRRFMAIMGPSGSGKSSIARAGLMPKIHPEPLIFRPGDHPLKELELTISDSAATVIIADQFEEIYSMCEDKQERTEFVRKMLEYAGSDKHRNISVIIVFRADFLGHAQSHPELSHAIAQNTIIVPVMRPNNLRAAIAEPAHRAGYVFDNQIVDELISQTQGHDGALPLLEFALSAIWQGMEKGVSPEKTLKDINGVGGALAQKAQALYDSLSEQDQRIAKRIFLSLTNVGEGVLDTRRRILLSEIIGKNDYEHVIRVLGIYSSPGSRLITLSAHLNGETTVEITHEALFEHWELFKQWIVESFDDIRFHRRLSEAAKHWEANDKAEGLLWQRPDLDLLKDFYQRCSSDMTEIETAFYHASVKREKRTRRLKQIVIAVLLILMLIAGGSAYYSKENQIIAEKERDNVQKQEAVAQQERDKFEFLVKKDYMKHAVSAKQNNEWLKAVYLFEYTLRNKKDEGEIRNCIINIHNLIQDFFLVSQINHEYEDDPKQTDRRLDGVAISKDQSLIRSWKNENKKIWYINGGILAVCNDGNWSYHSPDFVQYFEDQTEKIEWSFFNPGASPVMALKIIEAKISKKYSRISGSVPNKDESLILTWSDDGAVRLWDTKDGSSASLQMTHEDSIDYARFIKDESMILTWSRDGKIRIWHKPTIQTIKNEYSGIENIDYDFPIEHLRLLIEVVTGTYGDEFGNIYAMSLSSWYQKRQRYIEIAEEHLKHCQYKHVNLYLKQKSFWETDINKKTTPIQREPLFFCTALRQRYDAFGGIGIDSVYWLAEIAEKQSNFFSMFHIYAEELQQLNITIQDNFVDYYIEFANDKYYTAVAKQKIGNYKVTIDQNQIIQYSYK